jgi:hypothetical protein
MLPTHAFACRRHLARDCVGDEATNADWAADGRQRARPAAQKRRKVRHVLIGGRTQAIRDTEIQGT